MNAPKEMTSLAFVFDTTGSMWDDLDKVKKGAQRILKAARLRKIQPLYNYLLIPFHDPEVGPVSSQGLNQLFIKPVFNFDVFSLYLCDIFELKTFK